MCSECDFPIPKDKWVEISNEELAKKGKTQFVYIPSNYPGPIAIDAKIKEKTNNGMDQR